MITKQFWHPGEVIKYVPKIDIQEPVDMPCAGGLRAYGQSPY